MTYSEKLKDPRWQKKRLEILERDKFCCKSCGDNKKTLHVHHLWYYPKEQKYPGDKYNVDPWDYESELLITICESCHENERSGNAHWWKYNEKMFLREIYLMGITPESFGNFLILLDKEKIKEKFHKSQRELVKKLFGDG